MAPERSEPEPSLFPEYERPPAPLAERLRPRRLDEIVGHAELLGPRGWLRRAVERGELPHLILWGPPGVGKTTLAQTLAAEVDAALEVRSAVSVGVAEVRKVVATAQRRWRLERRRTILFLDEIHRFNKAQQDVLLGDVERGTVTLIGATTENPAFSITNALLSRVRLVVLEPLADAEVLEILERALRDPRGLRLEVAPEALAALARAAAGDARVALSLLEALAASGPTEPVTIADLEAFLRASPRHDRTGDLHYDVVSAWIKTMRGGDVDAALYWAARLWEAGEDRRFLFRRLIIFAAEDVGLADPEALQLAVAAAEAFERVGEAEGWIPFAEAVVYVTAAPKSKSAYRAFGAARELVAAHPRAPVPTWLRNAPTRLAKALGHGRGYVDPHREPGGWAPQVRYLPTEVPERELWRPTEHGDERRLAERWRRFQGERRRRRASTGAAATAAEADATESPAPPAAAPTDEPPTSSEEAE